MPSTSTDIFLDDVLEQVTPQLAREGSERT